MREVPGSLPAPAGLFSPERDQAPAEGTALDASHADDGTRRPDSQRGDRAGERQPAQDAPDLEQETEPDLDRALDLARAGDEHGFAVLWRCLHPPLLRYL